MNDEAHPLRKFQLQMRVRYQETDGQGRVHHANYLNYFECARVEMLRQAGWDYRKLEEEGLLLVVTEMDCRYQGAAVFDDLLTIDIETTRARGTRIEHRYRITCESQPIVSARSMVACVGRNGRPVRLPDFLTLPAERNG